MKKETLKTTANRRVYKLLKRKLLYDEQGLCHYCGPHSGCNSMFKAKDRKNWKLYRKTQWKD
jgi:hypothetical protein